VNHLGKKRGATRVSREENRGVRLRLGWVKRRAGGITTQEERSKKKIGIIFYSVRDSPRKATRALSGRQKQTKEEKIYLVAEPRL